MQYHVGNECQDADDWNFFGVSFKITDFLPCLISKYHYQFTYHHSYIFQFNDVKTSTAKFLWAAQTKKRTACMLMELHVISLNFMKVQGTECKLRELHASLCNCMQAHGSACILEHSGTYSMNYGTFWNFLHAFWNILELSACILEHSGTFCTHTFCMHFLTIYLPSGTFCMHSGAFWNILHALWDIILHAFCIK